MTAATRLPPLTLPPPLLLGSRTAALCQPLRLGPPQTRLPSAGISFNPTCLVCLMCVSQVSSRGRDILTLPLLTPAGGWFQPTPTSLATFLAITSSRRRREGLPRSIRVEMAVPIFVHIDCIIVLYTRMVPALHQHVKRNFPLHKLCTRFYTVPFILAHCTPN